MNWFLHHTDYLALGMNILIFLSFLWMEGFSARTQYWLGAAILVGGLVRMR